MTRISASLLMRAAIVLAGFGMACGQQPKAASPSQATPASKAASPSKATRQVSLVDLQARAGGPALDGFHRAQFFDDPGKHSTLFDDVAFDGELVGRDAVQLSTVYANGVGAPPPAHAAGHGQRFE